MLRPLLVALVVLVPLSGAALLAGADQLPASTSPTSYTEIPWTEHHLSAQDSLPGSTGWFAIPFSVDRPAYVRFQIESHYGGERLGESWIGILAIEGGWAPGAFGEAHSTSRPIAELDIHGKVVDCCMDASTSWSGGESEAEMTIPLQPGQVAWFGVAAHDWDAWDDAYLRVSGQAQIEQGEPLTGTRVQAVDLSEEAMRNGVRAQLFGGDVVAIPAAASVQMQSEDFGLFRLYGSAWADGGSARLSYQVPGEDERVVTLGPETHAFALAHRAGSYHVALDDIEMPMPGATGLVAYDWLDAHVFFADISVPGDVAYVYP